MCPLGSFHLFEDTDKELVYVIGHGRCKGKLYPDDFLLLNSQQLQNYTMLLKSTAKLSVIHFDQIWQQSRHKTLKKQANDLELQFGTVISKSKGLSETLRDVHTATYQICKIEEKKVNPTTIFHK